MLKICVVGILLSAVASHSYAQESGDSSVQRVDSLFLQLQLQYQELEAAGKRQRRRDSLERLNLRAQIARLQNESSAQREQLQSEIRQIEVRDSLVNVARKQKVLYQKESLTGYPVAPFEDTLFSIYLKVGPVLAEQRALSVSEKINLLASAESFDPDSLQLVDNDLTTDIIYGDLIVMSITDWDALWYDRDREALGSDYLIVIKEAVVQENERQLLTNLFVRIGLVVLILLLGGFFISLLNRLFRKLTVWINRHGSEFFTGVKLKNYEFLPPRRQLAIVTQLIILVKWLVFLVVLYVTLPLVFSVFPFTQGWAHTLFSWVWDPARDIAISFIGFLPNLFSIGVISVSIYYLIKFFRFLSKEVEDGRLVISGFHADWAPPTFSIVKVLLYAFLFVAVFPYLPGSDSPIFRGVSVFLGILFSLGSSTAIANAVSGVVITYMRPFRVGDRVKIGEVTGEVMEKSLLVTRIKTTKNEYITVPNASVLTGHTVNYSTAKGDEGLILHTSVTIGYDVPWRKVHEVLILAGEKTAGIDLSKAPFVLQTSLDDNYVAYQLNVHTQSPELMPRIYSDLHSNIQDLCKERDIEILSPHYRAVRDGNDSTIPGDYPPMNP